VSLSENLAAEYAAAGPTPAAPSRDRPDYTVTYDERTGRPSTVTAVLPALPAEDEWTETLRGFGVHVEPGYRAVLVEAKTNPAAWRRDQADIGKPHTAYSTVAVTCRWAIVVDQVQQTADDLMDAIARWKPPKRDAPNIAADTFTVVYADMQIGKWEAAGGTDRTIARVLALTDQAVAEYRALAKRGAVGPVALIFPGDGCEGFLSQGGRLVWRTDLAVTEMVRVYRRLLAHAVMAFAKVAPAVTVVAVAGNHDEASRQVATRHDDSWDIDAAAAVAERLGDQPEKFGHVRFAFPGVDKDVVTLDLSGTIVAVAHGHQCKGGAEKWWAGQAHGMLPAGDATLLLTGHYHSWKLVETGNRCWIQAPSLDNGSEWYTRETGENTQAGLLTLTIGRGGFDRVRVLREASCASS
jgi:predicted phosphodiesterase